MNNSQKARIPGLDAGIHETGTLSFTSLYRGSRRPAGNTKWKQGIKIFLSFLITLLSPAMLQAAPYQPRVVPEFFTGINVINFQQCATRAATNCSYTKEDEEFKQCLTRLPVTQQCKQFSAFAKLADFGAGSRIDAFNTYNDVNIFALHVVKFGSNEPGDFYFITRAGEFIKVTDVNISDITKEPRYQSIADLYPAVELYPVIRQMPMVMQLQNSNFLFTFKFPLRDGCETCELIGYADIGFEFLYNGKFKDIKLLDFTNASAVPTR